VSRFFRHLTHDRMMIYAALLGAIYTTASFVVKAAPLPARMEVVEVKLSEHCAKQDQYEKDMRDDVREMKSMLRVLITRRNDE
jgi:hypothetical protein